MIAIEASYIVVHQHGGCFLFSFVISQVMTSHENALYLIINYLVQEFLMVVLHFYTPSQTHCPVVGCFLLNQTVVHYPYHQPLHIAWPVSMESHESNGIHSELGL